MKTREGIMILDFTHVAGGAGRPRRRGAPARK